MLGKDAEGTGNPDLSCQLPFAFSFSAAFRRHQISAERPKLPTTKPLRFRWGQWCVLQVGVIRRKNWAENFHWTSCELLYPVLVCSIVYPRHLGKTIAAQTGKIQICSNDKETSTRDSKPLSLRTDQKHQRYHDEQYHSWCVLRARANVTHDHNTQLLRSNHPAQKTIIYHYSCISINLPRCRRRQGGQPWLL